MPESIIMSIIGQSYHPLLDHIQAEFLVTLHHAAETGIKELAKVPGRHKRSLVIGIIIAGIDDLHPAGSDFLRQLKIDVTDISTRPLTTSGSATIAMSNSFMPMR